MTEKEIREVITNASVIRAVLELAVTGGRRARVSIDEEEGDFSSIFVALKGRGEETTLLMDELMPKQGMSLLRPSSTLKLVFEIEGVRYTAHFPYRGGEGKAARLLKLALPRTMERLQRRMDYRAKLPAGSPNDAQLLLSPDGTEVPARIEDLSAGGVGISLKEPPEELKEGSLVHRLSFSLPSGERVSVGATVRYIAVRDVPGEGPRTFVGLKLRELPISVQDKIHGAVLSIQREILKRTSRD
ncbi:MAG: flagellar brake protein [Nitrospinota bacterium]